MRYNKLFFVFLLLLFSFKNVYSAQLNWNYNVTPYNNSFSNTGIIQFNLTSNVGTNNLYVELYFYNGTYISSSVCEYTLTPPNYCYYLSGAFYVNNTNSKYYIRGYDNAGSPEPGRVYVTTFVGTKSRGARASSMPVLGSSDWSYDLDGKVGNIQNYDIVYLDHTSTASLGGYMYINYTKLNINYDVVNYIYINGSFKNEALAGTCYLYLWNFTYSTWTQIDSFSCSISDGDKWRQINITSNAEDFLSKTEGLIFGFGAYNVLYSENMKIDYLKIEASVLTDLENPKYSNVSVSYPSFYNPNTLSNFSINATDDNGISLVYLESNFTGVLQNYTMSYNGGNNYGYSVVLPAGNVLYRFYIKDVSNKWNSTTQSSLTISKNSSVTLSIGPLNSVTYGTYTQTGCAKSFATNNNLILYRNGTQVALGTSLYINETSIVLGAGTYNYTCVMQENQNYTGVYLTNQYRTVNKGTLSLSLTLNGTAGDRTYTYPEDIGVYASESNTGDNDCSYTLLRNGTIINSGSSITYNYDAPAGVWNFTYYTTGCSNYTANQLTRLATVNKGTLSGTISISPSDNIVYGTQTTTSYTENNEGDSDIVYKLYRNNVEVTFPDVIILGAGTYTYKLNTTIGPFQNYTYSNSLDTKILTVNKGVTSIRLWLNGTEGDRTYGPPLPQGVNFTAVLNVSGKVINLYTNLTGWMVYSSVTPLYNYTTVITEGKYNITAYFNGDDNYTASSVTYWLTANSNTAPVIDSITEPTDPATYLPYASYTFKVRTTDNEQNWDKVNFTFGTTTYLVTNYTIIDSDTREYNITLVDLSAQTLTTWKFCVNDTYSLSVCSDGTYTINKATPTLTLTGNNVTLPLNLTVIGSETNNGDGDLTYILLRNGTQVSNPHNQKLSAGVYNFTYYTNGGQNYTSNSISSWFNVSVVYPIWSNNVTSPLSPITYGPLKSYLFNISWYVNNQNSTEKEIIFESNHTGSYQNYTVFNYSGLVGYWSFDEGSGSYAYDKSGNDWTAILINKVNMNEDGIYGKGAYFYNNNHTQNGYINMGADTKLVENFTISMWVKFNLSVSDFNTPYLISKRHSDSACGWKTISIDFEGVPLNKTNFVICTNNTGNEYNGTSLISNTNFFNDKWYHIVGNYNGTHMSFWVDGSLDNIKQKFGKLTIQKGQYWNIGSLGNNVNYYTFNGTIDEVMIFNRSLTDDEIKQLYYSSKHQYITNLTDLKAGNFNYKWYAKSTDDVWNSTQQYSYTINKSIPILSISNGTHSLNTSGLVGYWDFDEGSGSYAYDKSGNNMLGSLSGNIIDDFEDGNYNGWIAGCGGNPQLTIVSGYKSNYALNITTTGGDGLACARLSYNATKDTIISFACKGDINKDSCWLCIWNGTTCINTPLNYYIGDGKWGIYSTKVTNTQNNVDIYMYVRGTPGSWSLYDIITTGPIFSDGAYGNSIFFNGTMKNVSSIYVSVPQIVLVNKTGNSSSTVSLWLKTKYDGKSGCCGIGILGREYPPLQMFAVDEEQKYLKGIYAEGDSGEIIFYYLGGSSSHILEYDKWYFVTFILSSSTYNSTHQNYTIKTYLNGSLIGSYSVIKLPSFINITRINGVFKQFSGYLDEVMIFNRSLSEDEIKLLYQSSVYYNTQTSFSGSSLTSQITSNLYRNNTLTSNPDTNTFGAGFYYYVYNTSGNENYTSVKAPVLGLKVNKATPTINDYYIDKNYINKSGSIRLWLNASFYDLGKVVMNTTTTTQNITITNIQNNLYYRDIDKNALGVEPNRFYINYVCFGNENFTESCNKTNIYFDYMFANLNISITPTSVYNSPSDYITVKANYTGLDDSIINNANCSVKISALEHNLNYDNGIYIKHISTASWPPNIYLATINCSHYDYQSLVDNLEFNVLSGVSGGGSSGGGGGGGGISYTTIFQENTQNETKTNDNDMVYQEEIYSSKFIWFEIIFIVLIILYLLISFIINLIKKRR